MPGGGFVTTYNDITERKAAEAELTRHRDHLEELVALRTDELVQANQRLEEARIRLHDAIESSPGAFSLFDAQDRLAVFNARYARLYPGLETLVVSGTSFESIIGKAVESGILLDAEDQPETWLSERMRQHRNPGGPLIRRRSDGRWLQIDERKTEEGGIVAWYTDITERKRSEDKLRELNQLKDRYLGMAAHDLRNPLSTIRGMSYTLKRDDLPDDVKTSFLSDIYNESSEMLILVNDLLDVSVIESGKMELRLADVNMASLLEERLKQLAIGAEKRQIEIKTDIQEVPDCLLDASKLRQVLDNLLTNALKFSPSATTVNVSCRCTQKVLEVTVTDQGEGIGPEKIDSLFKPFNRAGAVPKHGEKAHGLGLFIVKSIIDAHHGEISVQSQPGSGTSVVVRIPTSLEKQDNAVS
jgi:signal transduction histidine kinase